MMARGDTIVKENPKLRLLGVYKVEVGGEQEGTPASELSLLSGGGQLEHHQPRSAAKSNNR